MQAAFPILPAFLPRNQARENRLVRPRYQTARTDRTKKSQVTARKAPTPEETETLKLKKAWEVALAPAKQVPMQAIMAYMSGNSLQIFSIMMVFML